MGLPVQAVSGGGQWTGSQAMDRKRGMKINTYEPGGTVQTPSDTSTGAPNKPTMSFLQFQTQQALETKSFGINYLAAKPELA